MREAATETMPGWKRAFINAFIVLHLYIIVFWGMPVSNFRNLAVSWVEPYVIKSGLWHSWDMFSPDPLAVNFNLEAHLTYENGTASIWEFPRMEKLGIWERYQKERYRKWRERVRQDAYGIVWNDTARFIARLNYDGTNRPTKVVLVRHWGPITPPATVSPASLKLRDYQPMPREFDLKFNYRFHVYDVKPEDL